jgi:hypothetical protein
VPLTSKEEKILRSMTKQYGAKKGKSVFYASMNKEKFGAAAKKRHKRRTKKKKSKK